MTLDLPDVNVLIALLDEAHPFRSRAQAWFLQARQFGWATCPITENGVIRVMSGSKYSSPQSAASVILMLRLLQSGSHHVFWEDDVSLLDTSAVDSAAIRSSTEITDTYLLALAAGKGGRLATFDRRLNVATVRGGVAALHLIP